MTYRTRELIAASGVWVSVALTVPQPCEYTEVMDVASIPAYRHYLDMRRRWESEEAGNIGTLIQARHNHGPVLSASYSPSSFFNSGQIERICHTSIEITLATPPREKKEMPRLSSRVGYTRDPTNWRENRGKIQFILRG